MKCNQSGPGFELVSPCPFPTTITIRRPNIMLMNNKQIRLVAVPVDHSVKIKKSEKLNKYMDLASELKRLWNMKVTVIPIVVGALGTVPKGLENRVCDLKIRGRIVTVLLKSAYLEESWRPEETCCHSGLEKIPVKTSMKTHID